MLVQPYLFFEGRCEEALEFYRKALNAEVKMLVRFKESPEPTKCAPGMEDKVMHAELGLGDTTLYASDGFCHEPASFKGFSLSITVDTEDEARNAFAALSDGGKVQMPLAKTFYSPLFGMLTDRYGVLWMIMVR